MCDRTRVVDGRSVKGLHMYANHEKSTYIAYVEYIWHDEYITMALFEST